MVSQSRRAELRRGSNNLGYCYDNGQGVAKDEAEAVKWYRKAAEQNDADSSEQSGLSYANGQGVAKDEAEAVKWYRKAAEQNMSLAQNNLGACYGKGQGVAKDELEALKWYRKAAEQNNALAQTIWAYCYYNGQGVAKDYVEAYKWSLLSSAQGDEAAKKVMSALERVMTREQIAEGQKLARNFKPRESALGRERRFKRGYHAVAPRIVRHWILRHRGRVSCHQ